MKRSFLLIVSYGAFSQSLAGYDPVDKKMAVIPQDFTTTTAKIATYIDANFKTDEDKLRAVFYWTATNIDYDVKNMMADNSSESKAYKVSNTLKTHKGVCIHYAEVFSAIANDLKIKNFIIDGFVKSQGKVSPIAHAWCAIQIGGQWFLMDPTWGAGGVQNGKYVKRLNNSYFKVAPTQMAKSHLPFDYLWQFLPQPLTFDNFISGKVPTVATKEKFDFEQEIIRYESLAEADRLFETVKRIESNGYKLPVVTSYLDIIRKNSIAARQNTGIDKMNSLVAEYNQAIVYLNDLIMYRNKKFSPTMPDENLDSMGRLPKEKLAHCQEMMYTIGDVGSINNEALSRLKSQINDAYRSSEEQYQFVQDYLKKSKVGRKLLFAKGSFLQTKGY
ncbi:transglutaminase domain-containing protein [Flavobacterium algicola]|uniref:transglutaminase domain-containing protein n=1 Tax=Flavobacterium algicola TaxID=556529 RepID=UPI001EFCF6E4|nr:transglutaminase domain-containing protein [Flavobacterium algicola]MCG9791587.1 hypothetical protein [Flavobacterium algicola]